MIKGINRYSVFFFLLFITIGIYLVSNLVNIEDGEYQFRLPTLSEADKLTVNTIKFLMLGVIGYGVWLLFTKISGSPLSRREAFTLIVIVAIILILAWPIIQQLFSAKSLDDISFAIGKKVGLLK